MVEFVIGTLLEMLQALLDGNAVALEWTTNQKGDPVEVRELRFINGNWILGELACHSAADFGLGTCGCHSHKPWEETEITRAEAMNLLKELIDEHQKDEGRRRGEVAWLEEAIADLRLAEEDPTWCRTEPSEMEEMCEECGESRATYTINQAGPVPMDLCPRCYERRVDEAFEKGEKDVYHM